MQQEEHTDIDIGIKLPTGRIVDVCTRSGMTAFLQAGVESQRYLSNQVKEMSKLCAKRRLNENDKSEMDALNLFITCISTYTSREVFQEHVQQSFVKTWLDLAIAQIKKFSADPNWIATGELPSHEASLLKSCASMIRHKVPVSLAFDSDFFHALAELVKARKGTGRALPSDNICDTITLIVSLAHHASLSTMDGKWTTEKVLTKLEATGMLEQFIRCATVPQPEDPICPGLFGMLNSFQACAPFINKKVRPGQPCGDIIFAILKGKDGSKVKRPFVLNQLKTMIRFAGSMNPEHECGDGHRLCQQCYEPSQKPLMKCARCFQAYYCSKECQKADWKIHKKVCTPKTKRELITSECIEQTFLTFCERHYVHIMVKMVKACEEAGLSKKDMVLELNFQANRNGIVPAMQDKPEFKIAPVKDYVEGSRPAQPDWFSETKYNVKYYLANIKEKYTLLQPHQFLCLVNYEGGMACTHVQMKDPTTKKQMFSEQAVRAFKAYMDNGEDGPLSKIFDRGSLLMMMVELGAHYGYGKLFRNATA